MTVTIMDGGMGGVLQARMGTGHGLWSATALLEAPEVVVDLHREFIAAGARIIITNSYSTVPSYLGKAGLEDRFEELTALAGQLARRAVVESGEDVLVAGSLPPLEESYRADLIPPEAVARPVYRALVEALAPSVDVYLCETMSTAAEARTAASEAVAHGGGKPVWVSWTLKETPGAGLRGGESVSDAFAALDDLPIAACLFNCTYPEAIVAALTELKSRTTVPLGCYPNRMNAVPDGWTLDNEHVVGGRVELDIDRFVAISDRCIEAGASIVGGCCGIGPDYIEALSRSVAA